MTVVISFTSKLATELYTIGAMIGNCPVKKPCSRGIKNSKQRCKEEKKVDGFV